MNKIYQVSELVGRRVKKGKVEYRVRWKGFPPEEDTWELGSSLRETCRLLIRMYNSQARSKKELSQHPPTMTAYASQTPSPHSSPPLKKTALSECSSDQLSVMSTTNCSPRSVSPALTASITPPISAPVKCLESPHSSTQVRTNVSKGTKRSPGKQSSSNNSSPAGGRKKVIVVFNSADGDSPPPSSSSCEPKSFDRVKRDYNDLDTAAKDLSKALIHKVPSVAQNRQLFSASFKQRETVGSTSGVAKEKRVNAQGSVSSSGQFQYAVPQVRGNKRVNITKETGSVAQIVPFQFKEFASPTLANGNVGVTKKYQKKKTPNPKKKKKKKLKIKLKTPKGVNGEDEGNAKPAKKMSAKAVNTKDSNKRSMKSGKKTREYIKLKSKSLTKMEKTMSKSPTSPLRQIKNYEPPMHQRQIELHAGSEDVRSVPVLIVYALDKIKKMKRKSDLENIHDLVGRMDSGLVDKKFVVRKTVAAMEKNGHLLRWEGNGGNSFRVSARALEELDIDNSDGYLSVACDKHASPSKPADTEIVDIRAKPAKAKKSGESQAKKRKAVNAKDGDELALPLPLTKRKKMLEENSEVSGSSSSLLPNDAAAPKESKSGNNSTHSSAGSTASGTSQSLVNKACSLIESIQNKSKTNAHVYLVGKHVLLVPPSAGGSGPDMSKQVSSLPHKRLGSGNAAGNSGCTTTAAPPSGSGTGVLQTSGSSTNAYPYERRISVRQTESAYKYKEIIVRKHDGFVEIALQSNSGTMKNVFTPTTLNELTQALQGAINDCESRLVLLTGSDLAFSHGTDLYHVSHCRSNDATARYIESLRVFLVSLANFPKPIIAAVNGPAIGLGAALLPLCDIVYASDKAHIQLPYCHLGQTPEGGSSFTLPHLVGPAVASDMFMSGRKLTAREACERGLVSEVFWPSVLMQQVIPRCRRIAQCPPLSLESTKCIIRSQMREQLIYAIESECSVLTECWENNECKRKIQEFLNSTVDSIL